MVAIVLEKVDHLTTIGEMQMHTRMSLDQVEEIEVQMDL